MALGWGSLALFFTWVRSRLPLPEVRWRLFYPLLFGLLLTSSWILVPHRMPVEFVTTLPVTLFLLVASWRWLEAPESHARAVTAALATGLTLNAHYGTKPLAFAQVPLLAALLLQGQRRLPRSSLSFVVVWGVLAWPTLHDLIGSQAGLSRFRTVGSRSLAGSLGVFLQGHGRIRRVVCAAPLLLGARQAYTNLDHYLSAAVDADPETWTYYPETYRLPASPVSPLDHRASTINARYEYVALMKNMLYCPGSSEYRQAVARGARLRAQGR